MVGLDLKRVFFQCKLFFCICAFPYITVFYKIHARIKVDAAVVSIQLFAISTFCLAYQEPRIQLLFSKQIGSPSQLDHLPIWVTFLVGSTFYFGHLPIQVSFQSWSISKMGHLSIWVNTLPWSPHDLGLLIILVTFQYGLPSLLGHVVWVTFCWPHCLGQIVRVTLFESHCVDRGSH